MVENCNQDSVIDILSTEEWLSRAQGLLPEALKKSRAVKKFTGKWKIIISNLEQIPARLSNLSTHPHFSKNSLCTELLQAVTKMLHETIKFAEFCFTEKYEGKLRMQSDLDALAGKLELNLRDCGLLIKTAILGEVTSHPTNSDLPELLARLQIGHLEAKHKALDTLVELLEDDERSVLAVIGRSNISALVQLLTTTSPLIREKTATVICSLAESEICENWLVSEGVIRPLVKLIESGSAIGKEKATIAIQRLSISAETARLIVGNGGVKPLVEICQNGDSVSQTAAVCALRNLSAVEEVQESLAGEGIVKVMIDVLDTGILLGSKEYATECLKNLTSTNNENLKITVISEGGGTSILAFMDGPLPKESAIVTLRNLGGLLSNEDLIGVLPKLVDVLKCGSHSAQLEAASTICQICCKVEMRRFVSEAGCIPLMVKMMEAKGNDIREVAAQAIYSLMMVPYGRKEVQKFDKSVPNLVALLDSNPNNKAKKYAVFCLGLLLESKRCKKLMISYGAIGYLKKLTDMEIPGAKELLQSLERGKLKSLFSRR